MLFHAYQLQVIALKIKEKRVLHYFKSKCAVRRKNIGSLGENVTTADFLPSVQGFFLLTSKL